MLVGYGAAVRTMSCSVAMTKRVTRACKTEDRRTKAMELLAEITEDNDGMRRTWSALGEGMATGLMKHILKEVSYGLNVEDKAFDEHNEVFALRMRSLENHAEALERRMVRKSSSDSTQGFKEWIQRSVLEGGGSVHAWCNAPNVALVPICKAKDGTVAPQAIANDAAQPWASRWRAGLGNEWHQAVAALRSFRTDVLAMASRTACFGKIFSAQRIRIFCRAFKARTAIGA